MPRITKCITIVVGGVSVGVGLFLAALVSSAAAGADPAVPAAPSLPGVVDQVIGSSGAFPQLLQSTAAALAGTPAQTPDVTLPGITPPAVPAGPAAVPGLPGPGNLASVLGIPLPNFGPSAPSVPVVTAPSAPMVPGLVVPTAPLPAAALPAAAVASPSVAAALIPGLP